MFIHYLRNFLRHCANNKLTTSIHVLGLSLGMAVCALLAVFVFREFSYDQSWRYQDRIFRVNMEIEVPNRGTMRGAHTMGPLRETMVRELPQVESVARLVGMGGVVQVNASEGPRLKKGELSFVDSEFFEIFDVETVEGDLARVRAEPNAIAVSESFALKHFETRRVLGKKLEFRFNEKSIGYEIVAVVKEAPVLSDLEWHALVLLHPPHFKSSPWILEHWYASNVLTYVKLVPGSDPSVLQASMADFIDDNFPKISIGPADSSVSELVTLKLLPIQEMHLDSEHAGSMKPTGDKDTSILYLVVAILVLAIACINFVNMSVARAMQRAREISIRKVLGASRQRILVQVTFESVLLALFSYGVALVWVELFAEPFFVAFDRPTTIQDLPIVQWVALSSLFAGLLGAVSGIYPALVISGFQPARLLKSNQSTSSKGASLARVSLVVTQFAISSALVVATGVLWAQLELANNIELGYEHESLVAINPVSGTPDNRRASAFKERLKEIPGVGSVALSQFSPGGHRGNNTLVRRQDAEGGERVLLGELRVGGDFFDCLKVKMLAGHDLSDRYGIRRDPGFDELKGKKDEVFNSHGVINRAALKLFGFQSPQEAIGKRLLMQPEAAGFDDVGAISYEIVGVVEDLRFGSLHRAIRPVLYTRVDPEHAHFALVQLEKGELSSGLGALRKIAAQWFPGPLTEVEMVDQVYYRAYEKERRDSALMAGAGLAALGVAALGLFGLSMFVVKQQRKEIGIRKSFGASSASIVVLMFLRFCRPLLVASILGSGLGLYFVDLQLQGYTERVDLWSMGLMLAILTILVHLTVAALAVAPHTLKVANMHPRDALSRD